MKGSNGSGHRDRSSGRDGGRKRPLDKVKIRATFGDGATESFFAETVPVEGSVVRVRRDEARSRWSRVRCERVESGGGSTVYHIARL